MNELIDAIGEVEDCYELLEIEETEWMKVSEEERRECLKTLADDVFFGLGSEPKMQLGQGYVIYDSHKHTIQIKYSDKVIRVINLI